MHADHIDALWDFLTSGRTKGLVEQLRATRDIAVHDISEVGSLVGPELKYFTVKIEAQGRVRLVHLKSVDRTGAGCNAMERYLASTAEVVREISRDEYMAHVPARGEI